VEVCPDALKRYLVITIVRYATDVMVSNFKFYVISKYAIVANENPLMFSLLKAILPQQGTAIFPTQTIPLKDTRVILIAVTLCKLPHNIIVPTRVRCTPSTSSSRWKTIRPIGPQDLCFFKGSIGCAHDSLA